MTSSPSDLNKHLFAQLERLSDETLNNEALEREVARTQAIVNLSEQVIDNAKLALDAAKLVATHGRGNWEGMLPAIEGVSDSPSAKPKGVPNYKTGKME